jgi:hypothetical protein
MLHSYLLCFALLAICGAGAQGPARQLCFATAAAAAAAGPRLSARARFL